MVATLAQSSAKVTSAMTRWPASTVGFVFATHEVIADAPFEVAAGRLADLHQGFAMPLLLAAICVALGGVFIAVDRRYQPPTS